MVQLGTTSINDLIAQLGPSMMLDPQMSFETITGTYRYVIQVRDVPFKIELVLLSHDAHDQERFRRRHRMPLGHRHVFMPTMEDVIVTKLRWSHRGNRRKDVDDVRDVIATQVDRIDWPYVHHWCDQHGTRELLDEIRRSIPPM